MSSKSRKQHLLSSGPRGELSKSFGTSTYRFSVSLDRHGLDEPAQREPARSSLVVNPHRELAALTGQQREFGVRMMKHKGLVASGPRVGSAKDADAGSRKRHPFSPQCLAPARCSTSTVTLPRMRKPLLAKMTRYLHGLRRTTFAPVSKVISISPRTTQMLRPKGTALASLVVVA